jgi:phage regulator Rha-like protein
MKYTPLAFTEQGIAMLSSVLNSERAISVNIQIIRIFTKMRELIDNYKELHEEAKPKNKLGFKTK